MQMFVCEECGCVESLDLVLVADHVEPGTSLLCSACLPVGVSTGGITRRYWEVARDVPEGCS